MSGLSVLHVTVGLTLGGAERAAVALAVEQKRRGHEVALWAVRRSGPFARELEEAGIDFWHSQRPLAGRALLKMRRPMVVHSALFWADLSALGFARARRAAAVSTLQNEWDGYLLKPWQSAVAPRLYRRFDEVTAVSEAAAASWTSRVSGLECEVIPNPTTPPPADARALGRELKKQAEGRRVVLCLGRLHPTKGVDRAIAAMEHLPGDVELWIVGEGEARAELEELAAGKRVRFLGPRDDVFSFYFAADCLVMPSAVEGMPLVALEALHSGVPIVASTAGGLEELLRGSPLPASDALDPRGLAARVLRALDDDEARAAFQRWASESVKDYEIGALADAYERVYERALKASA